MTYVEFLHLGKCKYCYCSSNWITHPLVCDAEWPGLVAVVEFSNTVMKMCTWSLYTRRYHMLFNN